MPPSTEIVSFYSFKGGTGRSTTLANVAHALSEAGANVGCMDLDLAAPGLHMIFPGIGTAHLNAKTIHDYLRSDESEVRDIEKYVINVGKKIERTPEGELLLISGDIKPPGKGNPRQMMTKALELREDFIDRYDLDYLLLDSRSGLSNHMIPLFDQADRFLAFHRWTHQHRSGTLELAKWLDDVPSPENMMSVASNVPNSVDDDDIETWVTTKLYMYNFSDFHVVNSSDILKDGERIVTLENPDSAIAEQYRGLADRLAKP